MTIGTVDQLRDYLTLSDDTPAEDLGAVLTRVTDMLVGELRFSFGGDVLPVVFDGKGRERLYLPPPGAQPIISISENGTNLEPTQYEIDSSGLFVLRLESDIPTAWSVGRRNIVITYAPPPAPERLVEVCLEEATLIWNGKAGGFTDTSGVQGSTEVTTGRHFTSRTWEVLRSVRAQYDPMRQAGRG